MQGIEYLIVLHAAAAIMLAGASIHLLILSALALKDDTHLRVPLFRLYPQVICVSFFITFFLGLFIYPDYRVDIRPLLEQKSAFAAALFEIKEHWLAMAAMTLPYLYAKSRTFSHKEVLKEARIFFHLAIAFGISVVFATLVGLSVTVMGTR